RRGTDLHLTAGSPPLVRIDGQLHPIPDQPMVKPADTAAVASILLDEEGRATLAARGDVDFAFGFDRLARVRGSAYSQRGSITLALRMIPSRIPSMEELGLPPAVQQMVEAPSGLILVTGPTGSGKSTTLASMIAHINSTRPCHILTIEDPIEYVHRHGRGAVNQREVGSDTESFARGLRSALREDPDVLMVGEMRDLESVETVLTLAETGHLVLATLHTNDTTQAVDRLVGVFPGEQQNQARLQISASLVGVVYQRLLPRDGGGVVAAYEILRGTIAVRNLIRESQTRQLRNAITMGQADGMQTLEMHLSKLVSDGVIDREDAVHRSLYPKEIARPAGAARVPAGV
ncbi:MAG TPA: type IV pilus twitching motility protein PilT, partial [Acidimicrobiia bacterium]|nr:type IV pilus twitching motility protein PilT [Acidimicrobiia bacterium]